MLRDLLHTNIELDKLFFEEPWKAQAPIGVNFGVTLPIEKLPGIGNLTFSTGVSDGKPVLIWQISLQSLENDVPQRQDKFDTWLTNAHNVVDKWFFGLCRGELLKTFE